jgi:hypothetical protein
MDEFARRIVSGGKPAGKTHIREVVCASLMALEIGPDGELGRAALESFHMDDFDEATIISNVDDRLSRAAQRGATLVTYNGNFHDLCVLRTRLLRWWHFEETGVASYIERDHLDLADWMRAGGRSFPSLRDACAGLGVSIRCPTFLGRQNDLPPFECMKCELDVLGTAILLLHYLAAEKRSAEPLTKGLPRLGRMVKELAKERQHFECLSANPIFAPKAAPWGAAGCV